MFQNYADLITAIDNWLGQRPELQPVYPIFVGLAEQRMFRVLRAREMMRRARSLLNEQYEWLPFDFLQLKRIMVSPGGLSGTPIRSQRLVGMSAGQIEAQYGSAMAPMPESFCVEGMQIRFAPAPKPQVVPDQTLDVSPYRYFETLYFARFPNLGPDIAVQSNSILQVYPELYLYGSLIEAEPYLVDDQRIAIWKGLFEEAVTDINMMASTGGMAAMSMGAA